MVTNEEETKEIVSKDMGIGDLLPYKVPNPEEQEKRRMLMGKSLE